MRRRLKTEAEYSQYRSHNVKEVFEKIYNQSAWGKEESSSTSYYSGSGSHDDGVVSAYVSAVSEFLLTLGEPAVVDLGCGDFHVGSQLRVLCGDYIACDVVPGLIDFNRQKYRDAGVEFRVIDIIDEELPAGDVVFIRQVLQHLSNFQIQKVIQNVCGKYKYIVLTEHLPQFSDFVPNADKPAGPDIRTGIGSGVVITADPFNFKPRHERMLCEVSEGGGVIRTTLYVTV